MEPFTATKLHRMTIEWKDSYKIGNTAIDAQHKVWFARINSFLEATDRKSLQYCEVMMNQYTREHLKYEEQLMSGKVNLLLFSEEASQ